MMPPWSASTANAERVKKVGAVAGGSEAVHARGMGPES